MVNIEVDFDACVGCGTCAELCPDTFDIRDEKSWVTGDGTDCDLAEAVDNCPTSAIIVEGIEAGGRKQV